MFEHTPASQIIAIRAESDARISAAVERQGRLRSLEAGVAEREKFLSTAPARRQQLEAALVAVSSDRAELARRAARHCLSRGTFDRDRILEIWTRAAAAAELLQPALASFDLQAIELAAELKRLQNELAELEQVDATAE